MYWNAWSIFPISVRPHVVEHVKYISNLCKTACSGTREVTCIGAREVPLHGVLQRLEMYFTRSTTCGLTEIEYILHVFHYMRSYRDWKCTSHVPIHAVLQRLEIYFTRSTTCGLTELEMCFMFFTEIRYILHWFQYMRSYRVGNVLHIP